MRCGKQAKHYPDSRNKNTNLEDASVQPLHLFYGLCIDGCLSRYFGVGSLVITLLEDVGSAKNMVYLQSLLLLTTGINKAVTVAISIVSASQFLFENHDSQAIRTWFSIFKQQLPVVYRIPEFEVQRQM
jgi:hypothetical protein